MPDSNLLALPLERARWHDGEYFLIFKQWEHHGSAVLPEEPDRLDLAKIRCWRSLSNAQLHELTKSMLDATNAVVFSFQPVGMLRRVGVGGISVFFFADVLIRREARAGAAEEEVEEGKRGGKEGRQEEDRMEEGRQVLLRSNVARFLASFMRAPWTFRAGMKLLRPAEMLLLSSFVVTQVFLEECRLGVLWTFRGGTKISGSAGMLLPCPFVDTSVASRCRLSVLLRSREERESHARRGCYCIPPSQKHK